MNIVRKRRKSLPREGVRKLMKSLNVDFTQANIKVGRDTLFNILRKHQMLTLRKKTSARTTNSYHRFYKYNNSIKDMKITKPNQVCRNGGVSFCSNDSTLVIVSNTRFLSFTKNSIGIDNYCSRF